MTQSRNIPSLQRYLRMQATRWALIGLGLIFLTIGPCVIFAVKLATERQLLMVAKSTTQAFRPMILEGSVRDAEFQIRDALTLRSDESAIVRKPSLEAYYPLNAEDEKPRCRTPMGFCWSGGFKHLSTLYPIYFDLDAHSGLYGYLEITMRPVVDWTIFAWLGIIALVAFVIQAFGLTSALQRSGELVTARLAEWAGGLLPAAHAPAAEATPVPFSEFVPMQEAVRGLHDEIARLQSKTAQEAKDTAQVEIMREMAHDLKTPLSQLGKFLMIHFERVRKTGQLDDVEVARIERVLYRANDLVQQLRAVYQAKQLATTTEGDLAPLDLGQQTETILGELRHTPEIERKSVMLVPEIAKNVSPVRISPLGFYQVLENLVRNAVQAAPAQNGRISVTVAMMGNQPALVVSDNGPGIPDEVRSRIFDFDYTTKPGQGMGIGLGIVKRICESVSAEIRLKSSRGQGTEFMILFQPTQIGLRQQTARPEQEYPHATA